MHRRVSSGVAVLVVCTFATAGSAVVARAAASKIASVNSAGVPGNGASWNAAMSADGHYVAFQSSARNFSPPGVDTNSVDDVFRHDLVSGETIRVSVSSSEAQADAMSSEAAISGDGRLVAFQSGATNLVAGDTNREQDIFLRDVATGRTVLVSVTSTGAPGNGPSANPAISADGHYVTFQTKARNIVTTTASYWHVLRRDLTTGETTIADVSSAGVQSTGGDNSDPRISADGRYVAFISGAKNLAPNDTRGFSDIFVHDFLIGETIVVSVNSAGDQGVADSFQPAISGDGRHATFVSSARNLDPAAYREHYFDVYEHDLDARETKMISVGDQGAPGDMWSGPSSLSNDGRYVAFDSYAGNLVSGDTNRALDVFFRDVAAGVTTRISVSPSGAQVTGSSVRPSLAADGSVVAYDSNAQGLVPGSSFTRHVFVRSNLGSGGGEGGGTTFPDASLVVSPPSPNGRSGWYIAAPLLTIRSTTPGLRFRRQWDSTADSRWASYTGSFRAIEGSHVLRWRTIDTSGTVGAVRSYALKVDQVAPSGAMWVQTLKTRSGRTQATMRSAVSDRTSGMAEMRMNLGFGWSVWTAYSAAVSINLPSGRGTKTVTAEYRDVAGNSRVLKAGARATVAGSRTILSRPVIRRARPWRLIPAWVTGYIKPAVRGRTRLYLYRRVKGQRPRYYTRMWVPNYIVKVRVKIRMRTTVRTRTGARIKTWTRIRTVKRGRYRVLFKFPRSGVWYARGVFPGYGSVDHGASTKKYFNVIARRPVMSKLRLEPPTPSKLETLTVTGYILPGVKGRTRVYFYRRIDRRHFRFFTRIWAPHEVVQVKVRIKVRTRVGNRTVTWTKVVRRPRAKYQASVALPMTGGWYTRAVFPGYTVVDPGHTAKRYFGVRAVEATATPDAPTPGTPTTSTPTTSVPTP